MDVYHVCRQVSAIALVSAGTLGLGMVAAQDRSSGGRPGDKFPVGLVSLHFDDGRECVIKSAIPILRRAKIKTDQYIVSGYLDKSRTDDYLDTGGMLAIQGEGHVIGGHTKSHKPLSDFVKNGVPDIAGLEEEIKGGRDALKAKGATPVSTFAYPFGKGADLPSVIDAVKKAGFKGARSTKGGYNVKTTNRFVLMRQPADRTDTTIDRVKGWVDAAAANRTWLILVFHHIEDKNENGYTSPKFLEDIVRYVAQQRDAGKIRVVTTAEGIELPFRTSRSE